MMNEQQQHQQPKSPQAVYSTKEVCQVTGLGRTTINRLLSAGAFVPKLQLSPGRVAFRVTDVQGWINARQVAA